MQRRQGSGFIATLPVQVIDGFRQYLRGRVRGSDWCGRISAMVYAAPALDHGIGGLVGVAGAISAAPGVTAGHRVCHGCATSACTASMAASMAARTTEERLHRLCGYLSSVR